ncbi:class I SAM-dependent methyltransferase [bacterium]|nr:class I SAM-dependent methyltransferase [bacterium]
MMVEERISKGIQEAHDRVAESYGLKGIDGKLVQNSYDAWNLQENVEAPLNRIVKKYLQNCHVLDAGCGNGQIAEILLSSGVKRIYGVDFSSQMLSNALKRMKYSDLENRFQAICADLENMDMLKEGKFDGAILFGVIEHLDNPDLVIRNILKAVKPEGTLVLGIPRKGSLSYFSYLLFGESPFRWGRKQHWWDRLRILEKADYYRFFSVKNTYELFERGSDVEIVERIPFAFSHIDGLPGLPIKWIGKNIKYGHAMLTFLNQLCCWLGVIPAGEFWIVRKI